MLEILTLIVAVYVITRLIQIPLENLKPNPRTWVTGVLSAIAVLIITIVLIDKFLSPPPEPTTEELIQRMERLRGQ